MDWWTDQQQPTSDQKNSLDLIAEVSKKKQQTKLKYNYSISCHNENDDGQITFNLLMASCSPLAACKDENGQVLSRKKIVKIIPR